MKTYRSSSSSEALALCLLLSATTAHGAPQQDRREQEIAARLLQAQQLHDKGEDDQAIEALRSAYLLRPLTRILLNLAVLHRQLGRHQDAVAYYERYLREVPAPPEDVKADIDAYLLSQRPAPPPPPPPLPEPPPPPLAQPRRPAWRLVTGGLALAAGAGVLGYGAWGLAMNGRCSAQPQGTCTQVYDSLTLGASMGAGGLLLLAGGVVLLALPGEWPRVAVGSPQTGLGFAVEF